MANLQNLLVDSDYQTPWIVWESELQYTLSVGDWQVYDTPHGLPFIPLLFGEWSTNSNFIPSYDSTDTTPGYAGAGQVPLYFGCSANSQNVRVTLSNNQTSSTTFYIRLMAFAPPEYTGEITPIEFPTNFRYNSDYRYQKLLASGSVSGSGTTGSSIAHNLGYMPQCRVWNYLSTTGYIFPSGNASVTNTSLNTGAYDSSAYYHIYGDPLNG